MIRHFFLKIFALSYKNTLSDVQNRVFSLSQYDIINIKRHNRTDMSDGIWKEAEICRRLHY